jgi:hypothetical protein
MRGAIASTVAVAALILAVAACDSEREPRSAGVTLPIQTLALPSETPVRRTTVAPTIVTTVATTAPRPSGTTVPGTTGLVGTVDGTVGPAVEETTTTPTTIGTTTSTTLPAPCDLGAVQSDIGPAGDGYSFAELRCAGGWATVVAKALDQSLAKDELVVLQSSDGVWTVVEGGGDTTCRRAGVPADVYRVLDCARWA